MTDNEEVIEPWMQQKGEQSKSFFYFKTYRDLGASRTIEDVIPEIRRLVKECEEDPNKSQDKIPSIPSFTALANLSSRWKWVDRCRVWDEHLDTVARTKQELEIKEMVERHANSSKDLQDAVLKVKEDPEFEDLTPTKKAWVLNTTTHSYSKLAGLERVSRGEPADMLDEEKDKPDKTAEEIEDLFTYAEGGNEEDDSD